MNRKYWNKLILTTTIVGILLGTFLLPACAAKWQKYVSDHGIRFERLRQAENGTIIGKIDENVDYQGYTCQPGWIRFYEDWTLKSCVLGSPIKMNDFIIPQNSWVEFDAAGNVKIVAFPENITIQHHECIGTNGDPKGFHTAFYPNGQLKYFFTPDPVDIFGIPCKGGFFAIIGLHENGHVKTCTLSKSIEIDGNTYKKGRQITLTPDGQATEASK